MTEHENFAGQATPAIVDTEYSQCNFSCPDPTELAGDKIGVRLFPGDDTPRSLTECNLMNRQPPPGSTVIRCNTALVETQALLLEEEVDVEGEPCRVRHYGQRVHGRYNPDTQDYEYFPETIDVEIAQWVETEVLAEEP